MSITKTNSASGERVIDRAVAALRDGDYKAFSQCFEEDGKYFDYCPSSNGGDDWFAYGREGIEMFFRNRFSFGHLTVSDPAVESESAASFFGAYDGPYVYAMFEIADTGDGGLIRKAVVHPI